MLEREVKVLMLEGPKKGEKPTCAYTSLKEITKASQTISATLKSTLPAPTKSKEMEENDQKVLGASSLFDVFGDLLV